MNMLGCAVVIALIIGALVAQQLIRNGYSVLGICVGIFVIVFCLWVALGGGGGGGGRGSGGEGNNPNNM